MNTVAYLTFLNPIVMILLILVPVIAYIYYLSQKRRKKALMKFSHIGLIRSASKDKNVMYKKHIPFALILLAITLLVVGLADPHIPLKQAREGVTVVLAIDNSGSMQATDYQPTRLEAAKASAKILLESLETKDTAGIITFESGATTAAYLSPFKDRVIDKLMSISPKEGRTAIGDGLSLAVDMSTSIPNKKRVVILLSDGVNNAGVISPQEAIEFAKSKNVKVYTIGMGSEDNVVLGYDFFGRPMYAELDEETLIAIAQQTGGEYFKSVNDDTLSGIYKELSEKIDREKEPTSIKDYLIALAFGVLVIELFLRYYFWRVS